MKKILLILFTAITGSFALAQYKPIDQGSSVHFVIKNLGFNVNGSLSGLDGKIQFDLGNLNVSSFDVSLDANTINTDNSMRDSHLRNESYFDVKNFPRIHFVSTKVTPSNKEGTLFIFGKLTIKNKTKDISFPFTATTSGEGYVFKGTFKINRKDFEIGGSSTISNELVVSLNILSVKS
jgi:polyisoprenoid-binding protein YceI